MKNFRHTICFSVLLLLILSFSASGIFAQNADAENLQIAIKKPENQEKSSVSKKEDADLLKARELESNSNEIRENSSEENSVSSSNNAFLKRVGVQTSDTLTVSLDDVIRRALQNNNDIEVARNDIKFQETQLRSLRGFYDPILSLTPTYTRNSSTGNRANNDFVINSNFTQNVSRGGGSYQAFFNNTRTENSFAQAQLTSGSTGITGNQTGSAFYSTNTGVQFSQPLLRNFGIDNTRRQIKIQRKRLQQSDADFRRQTIEIIAQVQRAYWDLVFALRDQQNRLANLNLAKENLRQIEAKINAGTEPPLARAEVNTEIANRETDLLLSTQQVTTAENTLKILFLRDSSSPEWSDSIVPTDKPVYSDAPISFNDAVKDAMQNRPELRRLNLEKEVNAIDVRYFKNQTKPRIDLVGSFSLNGISRGLNATNSDVLVPQFTGNQEILRQSLNTLLPPERQIDNPNILIPASQNFLFGGFNQSFGNIFRSDAPNYSVGVTIEFPLRNRTASANLAGARVTEQQISAQTRAQEQVVLAEVRNAVQAVETARLRVQTARRAREFAEIQLEGERKLFEVGRSTTFLLFQRENTLTNARNSEIRAETDFNKALADLQRATSTTFLANNIQVESSVDDK